MTEGSNDDGNFLVRVRAQVMTRDDSTGGWVPLGGGGLSNVSVRKRVVSSSTDDVTSEKPEYLICGKRISDQTIVLSCTIKKDFQYNKVMPTFHHWRTGNKKFGLTFQTAADARAFDKGVRNAVENLLDGIDYLNNFPDADVGDDDVFMTVELPVDSRSSSGSSSGSGNGIGAYRPTSATPSVPGDTSNASSPYTHPHTNQHHLHRMHFMRPSRTMPGVNSNGSSSVSVVLTTSLSTGPTELQRIQAEDIWVKERTSTKDQQPTQDNDKIEPLSPSEPYSYVQFAKGRSASRAEHEYCYPSIDSMKSGPQEGIKKPYQISSSASEPPLLPSKKKGSCSSKKDARRVSPTGRAHCRHCLEAFNEEDNQRGNCEYAPDRMLACINTATCIKCAQCMLYHCMADTEGDYTHHPCSCDVTGDHCHRRWTGLALLSIFVPCLWCYLPLRACHRCGATCGLCGGKHEAP